MTLSQLERLLDECDRVVPVWDRTARYGLTSTEWALFGSLQKAVGELLRFSVQPVTPGWLKKVGFGKRDGNFYEIATAATADEPAVTVHLVVTLADDGHVFGVSLCARDGAGRPVGSELCLPPVDTQGGVRRLADALGATLME
mgnify:CR=1 FL=1